RERVVREDCLLSRARRVGREKACRSIAAHVRNDDAAARQNDFVESADVVGKAVQEDDRRACAPLFVGDVEDAVAYLLQRISTALSWKTKYRLPWKRCGAFSRHQSAASG